MTRRGARVAQKHAERGRGRTNNRRPQRVADHKGWQTTKGGIGYRVPREHLLWIKVMKDVRGCAGAAE